jgi:protein Tex
MSETKHLDLIAQRVGISLGRVRSTINLLDEGATIPFIARYRKEATGELDEVQIAEIQREHKKLQDLDKRKESVLGSIEEQGKLTDELRQRIAKCFDLTELEDIYLPYKRKKKTRASMARERGLEPLATRIFEQRDHDDPEILAGNYLNDEVPSPSDALQGARDIIAEWVNENEDARNLMRRIYSRSALLTARLVKGKEQEGDKYKDYFNFSEPLSKSPSHRVLAVLRGEEEGFLRVLVLPEDEEDSIFQLGKRFLKGFGACTEQVKTAIQDCYERLLSPSIETETRNAAKEKADKEAIAVFAENLRQLLLAAPLGQKRVLGIDPGFRTGCKVVVLDDNGNLQENLAIYPHPPQNDEAGASKTILHLVDKYGIDGIAVGNGTAGRETMDLCRRISFAHPVQIYSVNEAGASIYSASEVAREEFPAHDVTVRGAISIGRRLMDPLAELVKIDPKSIGVGQYQHDVNQPQLKESLDQVVESCVNRVGVNLNTASKHLLTYISGLGPSIAQNIVEYRAQNGAFKTRSELKKVARLGDKAFEQCAGFLRIREAKNPLDNTAVHPESYPIVEQMSKDLACGVQDLISQAPLRKKIDLRRYVNDKVGLPTLQDILKELEKPGLDPRGTAKAFEFASIFNIEELRPGMVLPGIVDNITNFGAFVDIGLKEKGLVHVSQMANRFIKSPMEVVSLRQEVMVRIVEVDLARKRIQLSMKDV